MDGGNHVFRLPWVQLSHDSSLVAVMKSPCLDTDKEISVEVTPAKGNDAEPLNGSIWGCFSCLGTAVIFKG